MFTQLIISLITISKLESIYVKTQSDSEDPEFGNTRRDLNRILGDISYPADYEMHWSLAVVAILPVIAILIAVLIWKFCKSGPTSHNPEAGSDPNNPNNKRSFSNEESSY